MSDAWNNRTAPAADEANAPSMQCRIYDRIPVQDQNGTSYFYCLELSAGNTFDFGFCRKENVPSLLKDVLTIGNTRVVKGAYPDLMIPTVPSVQWVKQSRKYDPSHVIMWLENSIKLSEEYKDVIPRLRRMGMRFAIRVDALGDMAGAPEMLNCLDYLLVDSSRASEYFTVVQNLRQKNPALKTIAFKREVSIFSFTKAEAKNFDFVLGCVQNDFLNYDMLRPKWQHEMLRTFAQLYSGIYDVKEVGNMVSHYPLMATATKGLMGSKQLTNLTIKHNNSAATLNETPGLTQFDIRNYLAISVGYNLFTMTEKQVCEQNHKEFDISAVNYEPFVASILFGKIVDMMSQESCDDVSAPLGFMTGFLRYAHVFLHDDEKRTFDEFPLSAVAECYNGGGGQLGTIIRFNKLMSEHKVDDALMNEGGNTISKELFYSYISHAFTWTDAVLRAIGIIKEQKAEDEEDQ